MDSDIAWVPQPTQIETAMQTSRLLFLENGDGHLMRSVGAGRGSMEKYRVLAAASCCQCPCPCTIPLVCSPPGRQVGRQVKGTSVPSMLARYEAPHVDRLYCDCQPGGATGCPGILGPLGPPGPLGPLAQHLTQRPDDLRQSHLERPDGDDGRHAAWYKVWGKVGCRRGRSDHGTWLHGP